MPWRPLPRIAFAVAIYPFQPSTPADLPLELGDELYIIERGGTDGEWCRGYLVAPPSLLAGLTSTKGQTLEARVFSGIFPRNCVEIREVLDDNDAPKALTNGELKGPSNGNSQQKLTNGGPKDDQRSSLVESREDDDRTTTAGEVSDVVIAKKGKPSQIFIHKLDEVDQESPRSAASFSKSQPYTPVNTSPRDPNAPKPAAPVPMLKIGDETPTSISEPLVDEIASCLREWHSTNLHELLLAQRYDVVEEMSKLVQELDFARRQLLYNVLTGQEKEALRDEMVWKLVQGNKLLGGEVVVRDPQRRGRLLTGEDSAVHLAKLQSEMCMLESSPPQHPDVAVLHHLLLEVSAVSGHAPGPVTLAAQLCSKSESGGLKSLSETYSLDIPSPEKFASMGQSSKLKTLFTEICATDLGDTSPNGHKLYLVISVRGPETPTTHVPSHQSRPSVSRDEMSSATNKPSQGINHSVKGSLKARRSIIWSKPRGNNPSALDPPRETPKAPPQSSGSTSSNNNNNNNNGGSSSGREQRSGGTPTGKDVTAIRTIGVGLVEVSQILRQANEMAESAIINVWSPSREGEEHDGLTEGFDELVRTILPSPSGKYTRASQAARLHLNLHPFVSSDADALVQKNPTIMHDVVQTRRIGFSQAPSRPRSDIYVGLSQAVFPPEALLAHPHSGQVPVTATTALNNLQLTMEVRTSSGARVERCIYPSSSNNPHTAWRTTIAARGAPWNQTIRLNIPAEQIPGSHLVMSIADAPGFPFALAWMPLWDNSAFIRDGPHSLILHAYDKHTSNIENGKGAYLSLPWNTLGKNESTKDEAVTGPVSSLRLDTYLCSTEYSQDEVILNLLSWRERPGDQTLDTLRRVLFVPEIEIVKQLSSVFDSLFGILVENAGNEEYEDIIFHDLVMVLGIVHDRRFNLGPLVDHYADNQFNFPFVTPCLIRSLLRLLSANSDPQQSRNLRSTFKVGRHVLKFIINARQQQQVKEEGIGITKVGSTFNRDIHTIFRSFETLMKSPSPAMVGSKTLIVQHFHSWLPELVKVLPKDEIIMIALSFMDSCKDVTGLLILYKLVLIQHYTQLDIFATGQERETLISCCASWLDPYWGSTGSVSDQYRDQVRLCAAIVAQLLAQPEPQMYQFMPKIFASYCAIIPDGVEETEYLSLLFSKSFPFQVKACKTKQKFDESLVELSAVMAVTSRIQNPKPLNLKPLELSTFLSQAFETHNSILDCEAYPESWLSMHVYNHRATLKSLEYLGSVLTDKFLPAPDNADTFDTKLWESFFMTVFKVVSSDALALETFPEQKRRAVWKIAGDVREQGASLLHSSWEAIGWETTDEERGRYDLRRLGGYQVQYVPNLIHPVMELCLSVHEGLRHVGVDVLRSMVLSEWDLNQDLSIIETEIISSLDSLFKTKHLNESIFQKLFIGELLGYFEGCATFDEELSNAVRNLIATVDELLDLFVASQSGSVTESLHTLRLMEYMKDMGREDIFIRYVHELSETQAAAGYFTEAGLALQFHADLYDWDPSKLLPELFNPSFPEQSSFERKETLYFSIVQHFEDAKAWSHALLCYKELAQQYEYTMMDFAKLSRTQGSMAKIYESVAKGDKQFSRYFRVIYKGLGFPPTLRDKEFIFECLPTERMATFTDRMQKENPAAQIVSLNDVTDYEGQFLQISPVNPQRDMTHPVYQRVKIPQSVREHLVISEPCKFSSTLKRHVNNPDVKEQWVERAVFTTAEMFPNILRRSEIVASEEIALSPIQTALERTWRKTQELSMMTRKAAAGEDSSLNNLTEALQQLLEHNLSSSSCVASYRQFLSESAEKEKEGDGDEDEANDDNIEEKGSQTAEDDEKAEEPPKPTDPMESALAVALIDHALMIKHALSLYGRPAYQATQAELTRRFEEAFAPEISSLHSSIREPSPLPSQRHSPNLAENRQPHAAGRSISPEQELIRSSRNGNHSRKNSTKQSVGHRIGSINPFKRHHGSVTVSTATTGPPAVIEAEQQLEGKTNGTNGEAKADVDNETVHSRATSHSKDGQSKRHSWFGGDRADKALKRNSMLSIAPSVATTTTNTPVAEETSHKQHHHHQKQPSRSASRDTNAKSHDSRRPSHTQQSAPPMPQQNGHASSWHTAPSVKEASPQPTTGQNSSNSAKSPQQQQQQTSPNNGGSGGGVRDSVMKRFSMLRGVGRKGSRLDFKADSHGPIVQEE